jgi:hypothetical protein
MGATKDKPGATSHKGILTAGNDSDMLCNLRKMKEIKALISEQQH